jgi:hypothetical protein
MAVAEAWVHPPVRAMRYVRSDELQQVFNFDLAGCAISMLLISMNASVTHLKCCVRYLLRQLGR